MSKTKLVVALLTVVMVGVAFALLYNPPWLESERGTAHRSNKNQIEQEGPQGVRGRVLLPDGSPAENALVCLVPKVSSDAIAAFLAAKTSGEPTPVVTGRTEADGTFALSLAAPTAGLELRITNDALPAIARARIEVSAGEWFDAGSLQFDRGAIVAGRVLDKSSKQPIANATVHVHPGSSVRTDAGGAFRCATVPDGRQIRIKVEADGFATCGLRDLAVDGTRTKPVEVQLEPARRMQGIIIDDNDRPIAGARITARRIEGGFAGPITVATRANGTFSIDGVADGSYEFTASAAKHVQATLEVTNDGEQIAIRLHGRGAVKLRVTGPDGKPVTDYEVSLLRQPDGHTSFVPLRDLVPRKLNAATHVDGWAQVDDLPHGQLRLVIDDGKRAATMSAAFPLAAGSETPEVHVQLVAGASVRGKVVDTHGKPIVNALVTAKPKQEFESAFIHPKPKWPENRVARAATTDAQGQYEITGLSIGPHTLHAGHETFFCREPGDVTFARHDEVHEADPLTLRAGAIVQGIATIAGKPTGQIEIELEVHPTRRHWDPEPKFFARAVSDEKGRFRFLTRVPPGHYWISGARKNAPHGQRLITLKRTGRALMITDIRQPIEVPFDLPPTNN